MEVCVKVFALFVGLLSAGAVASEAPGMPMASHFGVMVALDLVILAVLLFAIFAAKNAVIKAIEAKVAELRERMEKRREEVQEILDKAPEKPEPKREAPKALDDMEAVGRLDERFWEVAFWAAERGKISVRELQGSFEMQAARAGELVSQMEKLGICAEPEGGTCRVLLGSDEVKNLIKRFVGRK